AAGDYYISCDTNSKLLNEEFECGVYIANDTSSLSFNLDFYDTVNLVDETVSSNWEMKKDGTKYELTRVNNYSIIEAIKFKFKINSTSKNYIHVFLNNVVIDSEKQEDGDGVVRVLSNNANLKNLYADGLNSLNFNQGDIEY